MDISNFKTNQYFDSIITQIIDNQLNHNQLIKSILDNKLTTSDNHPTNEYFVNYFLKSLHLSCFWIINNNNPNAVNRSAQNSPMKAPRSSVKLENIEVKRNLFEILNSRLSKANVTIDQSRTENIDLRDDELFPKLNSNNFIKTPNSAERRSIKPIQSTSTLNQPKSQKKQRRINPTSLQIALKEDKSTGRKTLLETPKTLFNQTPEKDKEEFKKIIKEISIQTPKKIAITNLQSLVKTPSKIQDQTPAIQLSLDKITIDKINFDNLIHFYFNLINYNLTPNILFELDFLLQLVTKRATIEISNEFLKPFSFCSNYHNCIYFAVKSLELLYEPILSYIFDANFFGQFSLNSSIRTISPYFETKLKNSIELDTDQIQDLSTIVPSFDFVAYQPETDSNENFPNDNSFHQFRKQRDNFFKLHYEWRQGFARRGFKEFTNDQEFTKNVSFIFSLSKDFANYFHLARLFISQLMQCCVGSQNSNHEQPIIDLFKQPNQSTPKVCENKMKKLTKRFNEPEQKVLATQSSFTGEEIFFYEFIVSSNNFSFLTILQSLLISKITELNNSNQLMEAIEFDENNLEIASLFCTNLLNLQLLAKFLGLIVFMPFYSKMNVNQTTSSVINQKNLNNLNEIVRNYHSEETSLCKSIDQMIQDSIKRKHLISTLPWVIQFLNQMDSNTSVLVNYDQVFNKLVDVYHELGQRLDAYQMNRMNYMYLELVFGNFFEKYSNFLFVRLFEVTNTQMLTYNDPDKSLDGFQLVNKKFLDACFPKLSSMKEIFKQDANKATEARRTIKPLTLNNSLNDSLIVASTIQTSTKAIDKKNLIQIEFEENFFRLHSDSLRKTVEFIADRLHSRCIKNIRYEEIDKIKKEIFKKYTDLSAIECLLNEIKDECIKYIKEFSTSKINAALDLLVSEHDVSANTINVCRSITLRILLDKCLNWMSNNINDTWIMNATLEEHKLRQQPVETRPTSRKSERIPIPNISPCFNRIRDIICDLLFKNQFNSTREEMISLIDELNVLRASKLNSRVNQVIETTIIDLIISVVTYQPLIMDTDFILRLVAFYLDNKLTVSRLISPRNLYILSLSNTHKTWDKFESILVRFTHKEIYNVQVFEGDVLTVINKDNEWNANLLTKLASCIKSVVDVCKADARFRDYHENIELVDWLSWFCGQQDQVF